MLRVHRIFLIVVFALAAIPVARLFAWKGVGEIGPMMQRVTPAEARPADTVTVTGFQLDSKHVRELYLSSGEDRYQADILTQTERAISFRVPANVPPGDFCIAMKLAGQVELIEQPVFLEIVKPVS